MKLCEVEFRAVITLTAQDMQKATLHGTGVIKESPHLIYVKAVHERNLKTSWGDSRVQSTPPDSRAGFLTSRQFQSLKKTEKQCS